MWRVALSSSINLRSIVSSPLARRNNACKLFLASSICAVLKSALSSMKVIAVSEIIASRSRAEIKWLRFTFMGVIRPETRKGGVAQRHPYPYLLIGVHASVFASDGVDFDLL